MKEKMFSFLQEYEEICKKYQISIEGCGCCGSPYLFTDFIEEGKSQYLIDEVNFDYTEQKVKCGNFTIDELKEKFKKEK